MWYGLMIIGRLVIFCISPLHETGSLEPVEQLSIQNSCTDMLTLGYPLFWDVPYVVMWKCSSCSCSYARHGNCHCVKIWSHCIHFLLLTNLNILSFSPLCLYPSPLLSISFSLPLPSPCREYGTMVPQRCLFVPRTTSTQQSLLFLSAARLE